MKLTHLRIGFTFFGFVLIGANSGAISVILPGLSSYYNVNDSTVGLFFFASATGYFLSALCSSLLLERLGQRRFLMLGAVAFLLGTLTLGIRPPFVLVLVTRLFLGFGVAFIETGSNAYVVALPRNTSLLNSLHAFYGVGALIGPVAAAALLLLNWGWNSVYLVWTALSIPLLIGFTLVFAKTGASRSPVQFGGENEQPQSSAPSAQPDHVERASRSNVLLQALRFPVVWWASLFLLFYVGVEVSLGNWSYTFLVEGQHQQALLASWIVSGYWLGLTLGRFLLSRIAERLGISNQSLILAGIFGTVIGVLIIWVFPFTFSAAIGFCFIGFSIGPIYPTTVALMPELVPSRIVSSAIGFLVSLSILGLAVFPWLAGILAQMVGIASLLPYTIGLAMLMLVSWSILSRSSRKASE